MKQTRTASPRRAPARRTPPPPMRRDTRPVDRTSSSVRNDKLTPEDVNRVGSTPLILTGVHRLWFQTEKMRGRAELTAAAVIVEVEVGGKGGMLRDYFVSIGRPDFIAAKKQLGDDLGQWAGQTLTVSADPSGRYVNVDDDDRRRSRGDEVPF